MSSSAASAFGSTTSKVPLKSAGTTVPGSTAKSAKEESVLVASIPEQSELDLLAEYNFFATKKQELLNKQQAEKRKLDANRRKAKREEALQWRSGGKQALRTVTSRVSEIRFLLKPHHGLRQCMAKLSGYQSLVPELQALAHRHDKNIGNAHYLLEVSLRERYPLHARHNAKVTNMIRKVLIMRSIHNFHQERDPFTFYTPEAYYMRHQYRPELKLFRFLSRYFAQQVKIPTEMRLTLAKKRELLRQARAKLQLINDTKIKCAKIDKCKSRQHYNAKGCSNCGVIFMGGSLLGAVPYVISVGRDTGVPTLVTLEFELQLLADEEKVQVGIIQEREADLAQYEQKKVYLLVATQLQPWWSCVILYRRYLRRLLAKQHSLFYYRIRRLVRLKQDVDEWIIAPAPIDCDLLGRQGRYVDLVLELEEYVALQSFYKRQRIEKYARLFRKKLVTLLEEARERRYQEWLRQQELANAPKPIVIKKLLPAEASVPRQHEHYRCYRAGCCRRKYQNPYHANMEEKSKVSVASFLTRARYLIHIRSHLAEDNQRRLLLDEQRRLGQLRQRVSVKFLQQLQKVREYLLAEMREAILPPHIRSAVDDSARPSNVHGDVTSSNHNNKDDYPVTMSIEDEILSWVNEDTILKEEVTDEEIKHTEHENDLGPESFQESISSLPMVTTSNNDGTMAADKFKHHRPFSLFHHSYQLLHLFHPGPTLSLELVSKHSSVSGPSSVPLDRYLMRIGTTSACEFRVSLSGTTAHEKRVGDIHCLIYIQDEEDRTTSLSSANTTEACEPSLVVKVVDNYSKFGTYVVGESGARKVSTRLGQGSRLTPGALLCIGVQEDGPPELSVGDASLACLVYKFHIQGALNIEE